MSGWKVITGELKVGRVTLQVCDKTLRAWEGQPASELSNLEPSGPMEQIRLPSYACAVEVANVIAKHLGKRKK